MIRILFLPWTLWHVYPNKEKESLLSKEDKMPFLISQISLIFIRHYRFRERWYRSATCTRTGYIFANDVDGNFCLVYHHSLPLNMSTKQQRFIILCQPLVCVSHLSAGYKLMKVACSLWFSCGLCPFLWIQKGFLVLIIDYNGSQKDFPKKSHFTHPLHVIYSSGAVVITTRNCLGWKF